jgi:hypothetical protein
MDTRRATFMHRAPGARIRFYRYLGRERRERLDRLTVGVR